MIIETFRPSQPVEAEAIISSPVVIVPVVLLVSLILIVVAVVCFIKIKRYADWLMLRLPLNLVVRSDKSSYLYTDNWYLRPSRSPSHSGSEQYRHSPVSVVAGPTRTSLAPARAETSRPVETVAVTLPGRAPYERQISRVRSLSVFSSDSHIHPDTQPANTGDNISLDFDALEEEEEQVSTD